MATLLTAVNNVRTHVFSEPVLDGVPLARSVFARTTGGPNLPGGIPGLLIMRLVRALFDRLCIEHGYASRLPL